MAMRKGRRPVRAGTDEAGGALLRRLAMGAGEGPRDRRSLDEDERRLLLAFLTAKRDEEAADVGRLIPKGSFLARIVRHFRDTDISYSLPLFDAVMIAASWLTQAGAVLRVRGLGDVHPTLWTIGLAESGLGEDPRARPDHEDPVRCVRASTSLGRCRQP